MGTFGWVLITGGFLVLIMVANNSWPWVWAKISRGMPQPGEGNQIVPVPPERPESERFTIPGFPSGTPEEPSQGNTIVPVPDSHIQSAPAGTVYVPNIVQPT